MDSYFFRVEHDLLRSLSFQQLGGSAIKVYLVIGLYSDFGTDWAYPSIRTIAKQAGLSRQTVLAAIEDLTRAGMLATSKARGKSTAYKIIRQGPERPAGKPPHGRPARAPQTLTATGPTFFEEPPPAVPKPIEATPSPVPDSLVAVARFFGPAGPEGRPKRDTGTREDNTSIPIPGTPFRLTVDGQLCAVADLEILLKEQGVPGRLAAQLVARHDPEAIAKVLLNALYLQSQGKLQNGPGYIRAGIEDGYELLPQVASRLEGRRRELEVQLRQAAEKQRQLREEAARAAEEAAIEAVIDRLDAEELERLTDQAIALLPPPIVRRNPTLTNPFVRSKVYELVCGKPFA